MPQIYQPRSRNVVSEEKEESDIDKLIKGLNVANGILGIATNVDRIYTNYQDRGRAERAEAIQKQALEDKQRGIINAEEEAALLKQGFTREQAAAPGLLAMKRRLTGKQDEFEDVFYKQPSQKQYQQTVVTKGGIAKPAAFDVTSGVYLVSEEDIGIPQKEGAAQFTEYYDKETGEVKKGKIVDGKLVKSPDDFVVKPKEKDLSTKEAEKENLKNIKTLSDEYNSDKDTLYTKGMIRSQQKLKNLTAKGPNSSVMDQYAIVYGFITSLDPNTGVKDAEIDSIKNSRSIPDAAKNAMIQLIEGDRLTEKQIKEVQDAADNLLSSQLDIQKSVDDFYRNKAIKYYKVDPGSFIPDNEKYRPKRQSETTANAPDSSSLKVQNDFQTAIAEYEKMKPGPEKDKLGEFLRSKNQLPGLKAPAKKPSIRKTPTVVKGGLSG